MARSLNEIIAELPLEEQAEIEARYQELKQEVESLRELRQIAGKAQAEIATTLHIKQPSVSKIEKQADMYLSTLRSYVEAVGGKLELVVKLPDRPALHLHQLGEVLDTPSPVARRSSFAGARKRPVKLVG
ncbi:MAG: XRE family transcriptional regulator [Brevundimonas subvibrioides]|uniref:XRE family transcriptional regulator n=1 Tax=Brevundimonas subvibrioides TaxID=74313 RepID=A0A258FI65_9CAUL|nr:MAG: XRE family transcriptional regulator [Brevundimonas subvibrioides]